MGDPCVGPAARQGAQDRIVRDLPAERDLLEVEASSIGRHQDLPPHGRCRGDGRTAKFGEGAHAARQIGIVRRDDERRPAQLALHQDLHAGETRHSIREPPDEAIRHGPIGANRSCERPEWMSNDLRLARGSRCRNEPLRYHGIKQHCRAPHGSEQISSVAGREDLARMLAVGPTSPVRDENVRVCRSELALYILFFSIGRQEEHSLGDPIEKCDRDSGRQIVGDSHRDTATGHSTQRTRNSSPPKVAVRDRLGTRRAEGLVRVRESSGPRSEASWLFHVQPGSGRPRDRWRRTRRTSSDTRSRPAW